MRKIGSLGVIVAASLSLGACATDRYGYGYEGDKDRQLGRAAAGAAVGAAAGAGVGAVVDGVSTTEGAIVGAIAGGAIGAATSGSGNGDRRWYRDDRGYCYWVDSRGDRRYDYEARC